MKLFKLSVILFVSLSSLAHAGGSFSKKLIDDEKFQNLTPNEKKNLLNTKLKKALAYKECNTAKALIEEGADPETETGWEDWTALTVAAYEGHLGLAQAAIDNGANVNFIIDSDYSTTPAIFAARSGHDSILLLLIKNNADLNYINEAGVTALASAANKAHPYEIQPENTKSGFLSWLCPPYEIGYRSTVKLLLLHDAPLGTSPLRAEAKQLIQSVIDERKLTVKIILSPPDLSASILLPNVLVDIVNDYEFMRSLD